MPKQNSCARALVAASVLMLIGTVTASAHSEPAQPALPQSQPAQSELPQPAPPQSAPAQPASPQPAPAQPAPPQPAPAQPASPQPEPVQPASPQAQPEPPASPQPQPVQPVPPQPQSAPPAPPKAEPALAESAPPETAASPYQAAIDSPLRTDADRQKDVERKPAEFLAFAQVAPGMKALDLGTGDGATAVLLAVAVTPGGDVWAHTSLDSPALDARVAGGAMPNLHVLLGPVENPIPKNLAPLDLISINMAYHEFTTIKADRAAMNRRLYAALKPGGYLVVIDNAAKPGSGLADAGTLHRIDEETVVAELTQAGFTVDARSDYLRVPSDPRELPFFKMQGAPDDKFAIRFVKKPEPVEEVVPVAKPPQPQRKKARAVGRVKKSKGVR